MTGRRARQAYLSSYRGHLDPASMAKWIAEHELGCGGTHSLLTALLALSVRLRRRSGRGGLRF